MIRNITSNDFSFIYGLYMHPAVNPFLLYEQMNAEAFKPIYQDLLERNIIYIFSADGNDVGMFKFIPQQHRNAHIAYLGGVAVDPVFAGKGYGMQMIHAIIELGTIKQMLRIELSVATVNYKAIALYEKAGFKKEGVMQKFTHLVREGRFIDEVLMSYLY